MKKNKPSVTENKALKIWLLLAFIFVLASSYFTYKQTLKENIPTRIQIVEAQENNPGQTLVNIYGTPIKNIEKTDSGVFEENELIAISYGVAVLVCGSIVILFFGLKLRSITIKETEEESEFKDTEKNNEE